MPVPAVMVKFANDWFVKTFVPMQGSRTVIKKSVDCETKA